MGSCQKFRAHLRHPVACTGGPLQYPPLQLTRTRLAPAGYPYLKQHALAPARHTPDCMVKACNCCIKIILPTATSNTPHLTPSPHQTTQSHLRPHPQAPLRHTPDCILYRAVAVQHQASYSNSPHPHTPSGSTACPYLTLAHTPRLQRPTRLTVSSNSFRFFNLQQSSIVMRRVSGGAHANPGHAAAASAAGVGIYCASCRHLAGQCQQLRQAQCPPWQLLTHSMAQQVLRLLDAMQLLTDALTYTERAAAGL